MFRPAYRWMIAQLRERVGPPPAGVTYPLWAWDRRSRVPPRRWTTDSRSAVAIVFDIAPENVLLSDFEEWYGVLNRWHIGDTEEDDERFSDECAARFGEGVWPHDVPELRATVEQTWPKIFEMVRESPYRGSDGWFQAVFWELRLDQVRRVIPLEHRPRWRR